MKHVQNFGFYTPKSQHLYLIRKSAQGKPNALFQCYRSGKKLVESVFGLYSISSCINIMASKSGICITNLDKVEFNQDKYSTHKIRLLLPSLKCAEDTSEGMIL